MTLGVALHLTDAQFREGKTRLVLTLTVLGAVEYFELSQALIRQDVCLGNSKCVNVATAI